MECVPACARKRVLVPRAISSWRSFLETFLYAFQQHNGSIHSLKKIQELENLLYISISVDRSSWGLQNGSSMHGCVVQWRKFPLSLCFIFSKGSNWEVIRGVSVKYSSRDSCQQIVVPKIFKKHVESYSGLYSILGCTWLLFNYININSTLMHQNGGFTSEAPKKSSRKWPQAPVLSHGTPSYSATHKK